MRSSPVRTPIPWPGSVCWARTTTLELATALPPSTFGPKHFFTPNIYGRAALRVDWYDGEKPQGKSPYNAGTKDSQELVVLDVVATF